MARKPVHLMAVDKRPEGRQVIWQAIRARGTFTIWELEHDTRIHMRTLRGYVVALTRGGFLEQVAHTSTGTTFGRATWKLIRDTGIEAPRVRKDGSPSTQGQARENLWRTLRIIRDFTVRELAVQSSTEDYTISDADAKDYIKHLHTAGYLVVVSPSKPGHKPGTGTQARYRLLKSRNTGPKPPKIQRTKQVFDPNLGKVMWREGEAP